LLSKSYLDKDTKIIIFRKGLSHNLQDKLIGLKSKDQNELQNTTIKIADQLYRIEFHTKGSSYSKQSNETQREGKHSRCQACAIKAKP
jgi:beta-galactosidase beta subunit